MTARHIIFALSSLLCTAPALACSYPVREHPILAARAPKDPSDGLVAVAFALDEVWALERRTEVPDYAGRMWRGARGTALIDGPGFRRGQLVEVFGNLDMRCFFPAASNEQTADGRLVVWVTGAELQEDNVVKLVVAGSEISGAETSTKMSWIHIRWRKPE